MRSGGVVPPGRVVRSTTAGQLSHGRERKMGMAMLWSKLDSVRRGTTAMVASRKNADVRKSAAKGIGNSTAPVERHAFRGDTIIALQPHRHPMQALCISDNEREPTAQELAKKLFKIRFADSDGRRRSASF